MLLFILHTLYLRLKNIQNKIIIKTIKSMTREEQKMLDFVLNEDLKKVARFVEKHVLPLKVQKELLENYPQTFLQIADKMRISTKIIASMIISKKKYWLPIIMKRDFFIEEEQLFIQTWPEKLKEYQDTFINDNLTERSISPDGEALFYHIRQQNPLIPDIKYIWHPEWNK